YIGAGGVYRVTRNADETLSWSNLTQNFTYSANGPWALNRMGLIYHSQCAIAFSPVDPRVIFFGNNGGLYKSSDAGTTFQALNDSLSIEQFYSMSVGATDQSLFFGSLDNGTQRKLPNSSTWNWMLVNEGGRTVINPSNSSTVFSVLDYPFYFGSVFRSTNRGVANTRVATNSTFGEPPGRGRIAFIPPFTGNESDSTLYYGTWRVFTSTDLGETWSPTGTTDLTSGGQDFLRVIAVSRSNPNVIYTASNQRRVMVSTNAGVAWNDVSTGLPNRFITSITIDRVNPAIA